MKVLVLPPVIDGDTVNFRWAQTQPNPFQTANEFFFRYEGIDLLKFSPALFDEIFLALQLKVFAAFDVPVEITFPEPVSEWTFAYWQAYHNADNVTCRPLGGGAYSPWRSGEVIPSEPGTVAVFFGGGKDSVAATCLFSEIYGASNVRLIQYVAPLRPKNELRDRLEKRQLELMLKPATERLSVSYQRVFSDYQSNFPRSVDDQRPEIELYVAGALPALLDARVALANFSYEWPDFPVVRLPDGSANFVRAECRPETMATHQAHFRETLGQDLTITNVNAIFSPLTGFQMVVERYPHAADQMVSCSLGQIEDQWCYDCRKCFMHAIYSMFSNAIDDRFDYDRVFDRGRFVLRVVEQAMAGSELTVHGNAPFTPAIGVATLHQTLCHTLSGAKVDAVAGRLCPNALANLYTLQAMYGNVAFPHIGMIPTCVTPRLGFAEAAQIVDIACEHFPPTPYIEEPLSIGDHPAEFGMNQFMPVRTANLPHIRSALKFA